MVGFIKNCYDYNTSDFNGHSGFYISLLMMLNAAFRSHVDPPPNPLLSEVSAWDSVVQTLNVSMEVKGGEQASLCAFNTTGSGRWHFKVCNKENVGCRRIKGLTLFQNITVNVIEVIYKRNNRHQQSIYRGNLIS